MRLVAAAVAAALLVARVEAQQVIQVSSASYPRYSLTNSLPYDPAMNCRGEVPSTLPKDCSGPYSGTGYVGDFVDACGVDYAVHCGMRIDSDPFAVYENVPELSKCMEACDKFPNCTSATHLGSRCLLDANASMKAVHGHPELAALIKGSFRGMRMQTAPPSMVREHRRQASRTSVNPAAATVPVCPNSNGQLYEDDYGALYIINCGAYNTGTNYTILWSRDSGCTTLRCCMDYCDGFQDCFGTALLLGSNNNNCTFFYPPNGTHYANTAYNIAYQYRAANQPDLELANKYTDSYLYNRIICHGHSNLVPHANDHQRGHIDLYGDHNSKPTWDNRDLDTAGINQHGHIYSTCKHKYSHIYSACKHKYLIHSTGVDKYINNDGKDHTNIHSDLDSTGVDKYINNYGANHPDLHPDLDTAGVDKYIDDHGANHTNIHASCISTERSTATSTERITATSTERITSTLPASTNTLTTTERTTATSTERTTERTTATSTEAASTIYTTLPASTDTETFTQRTTEQTTVISYPPASTNTATQTEISTLLTTQNVTQILISNLPGTTVTTTSILLSSYPLTQTETTSLLLTSTSISTYETTEVITSVLPTSIISTYPITYTSLQNVTTTLSGPALTETQRLTATNNVTATNTQTTTEQVPTYINRTTTLEASTITRTDTIFAPTETTTARDISTLSQPRETTTERETSVVYGTTTERDVSYAEGTTVVERIYITQTV
ncbi:hypothetical protein KC345_g4881 [Hortaea werneckii]|nr:hypothetical protein KC345_g4881 [Hortaea werneckii]